MKLTDQEMAALRKGFKDQMKNVKYKKRPDKRQAVIEFKLTFEEWLAIWVASGQHNNRGTRKGQYCMSRISDLGHYEPGNVFIQLSSENARQGKLGTKHTKETKDEMSAARKGKPNGKKGKTHSVPAWNKGKALSAHHSNSISVALTGFKYKVVTCPHCGEQGGKNNMPKNHFDNCKHKGQRRMFRC